MIDTAPLYDAINHRYKGVYPGPKRDQWDAIVQTTEGKLKRLGRFTTQDAAARVVAEYYKGVYGQTWAVDINKRAGRRPYKITRYIRFLHMGQGHKGPKTIVYRANVLKAGQWFRIIPDDILIPVKSTVGLRMWREDAQGWRTMAAALVAIRTYRMMMAAERATIPEQSTAEPRLTDS